MNKKVRMTALAKRDFAKILEYLEEKWSNAVAHNFIKIVEVNFSGIALDRSQKISLLQPGS